MILTLVKSILLIEYIRFFKCSIPSLMILQKIIFYKIFFIKWERKIKNKGNAVYYLYLFLAPSVFLARGNGSQNSYFVLYFELQNRG
jgi:hypothetical protein